MPSPPGALLKVVIRGTQFLAADTSAPLVMPGSIPPNTSVGVPGELKAFIRQEGTARNPGQVLRVEDTVSLIGYSERLCREIPEFSNGTKLIIQYPVQLASPAHLDCMTKAEEMTISWMVCSIS